MSYGANEFALLFSSLNPKPLNKLLLCTLAFSLQHDVYLHLMYFSKHDDQAQRSVALRELDQFLAFESRMDINTFQSRGTNLSLAAALKIFYKKRAKFSDKSCVAPSGFHLDPKPCPIWPF